MVEDEWAAIKDDLLLDLEEIERIRDFFSPCPIKRRPRALTRGNDDAGQPVCGAVPPQHPSSRKMPGYRVVFPSLKAPGKPPEDLSESQMDALADRYGFGEIRVTHMQETLPFSRIRSHAQATPGPILVSAWL